MFIAVLHTREFRIRSRSRLSVKLQTKSNLTDVLSCRKLLALQQWNLCNPLLHSMHENTKKTRNSGTWLTISHDNSADWSRAFSWYCNWEKLKEVSSLKRTVYGCIKSLSRTGSGLI